VLASAVAMNDLIPGSAWHNLLGRAAPPRPGIPAVHLVSDVPAVSHHPLDEHYREIAADRDSWQRHAGAHYREVAHWLRGVAARCRLPYTQRELLNLARRYERRADHFGPRRGKRP
jgi:hypothetical protein